MMVVPPIDIVPRRRARCVGATARSRNRSPAEISEQRLVVAWLGVRLRLRVKLRVRPRVRVRVRLGLGLGCMRRLVVGAVGVEALLAP